MSPAFCGARLVLLHGESPGVPETNPILISKPQFLSCSSGEERSVSLPHLCCFLKFKFLNMFPPWKDIFFFKRWVNLFSVVFGQLRRPVRTRPCNCTRWICQRVLKFGSGLLPACCLCVDFWGAQTMLRQEMRVLYLPALGLCLQPPCPSVPRHSTAGPRGSVQRASAFFPFLPHKPHAAGSSLPAEPCRQAPNTQACCC